MHISTFYTPLYVLLALSLAYYAMKMQTPNLAMHANQINK
jgi:hypothetical protein